MDLVSLVITPVVESLMVPIKKHLGFLISSPKFVNDMEARMKQLEDTAREVQRTRDTAVANTEVVPEHVASWLKDVEKMNDRVKSIPTGAIGCFNVSKRYKAGKKSYDILKEIEDLKMRESKIKFTKEKISLAKVPCTSEGPSTSTLVLDGTHDSFASRDVLFNDALKSLQSNDETQKMIALCGPGGVGKTTLMEQLKKAVEDSKMFHWVVKVVVGEDNDAIALQRAIAEYISVDLTETTKDARVDRLRKTFEGMSQQGQNKILVIMDDIWKEFDLKDVGLMDPLPDGFKVLFTSRFEYVCTRMSVRNNMIFRVNVLNDVEAISLFFRIVGPSPSNFHDPELQSIGEDIAKKCGGLPIALKTMADNLRGNVKDAWKEALSNLQHDDLQDLNDIVHKVFEISYNNLEKEDDKAIFLLSGLFPDDFNIRTEDLMRYGWGLKLFTNVHTLAEARRRTNICVSNLIRANLLTESETTGCVKMHDLMRAFVLSNFTKVKQASTVNHNGMSCNRLTKDANESYERILLKCTGMSKFPVDFNYPNLSMLMLIDGYELLKFPEDTYERMDKLEVMSFENMHIPRLPVKFEHSTKLGTLCLRSCRFINDDISLVGNLSNLETLSFADCGIRILPSTIGKLRKLKLLDLTGCVDLRIDDGVFKNLCSLEELYMRAHDASPIRFTKANCEELEMLSHRLCALELEMYGNMAQPKNMSFKNLERFRISVGCQLVELRGGENNLLKNTIQYVGDCNELLECEINALFNKTVELGLQVNEMNRLEDVLMHYSFSNLTVVHVSKCVDLTCLFTFDVVSCLKKLERLTVSECPGLRTLVAENSRVGVIRFHKLTFMCLTDLPKLVSFCDNVIEFPQMVELILDGLPNFTSIYPPHTRNTFETQSLLNNKVVIPRLEILDISRMENLKHVWPCETATDENNVSMFRMIRVRECDNLISLFPSSPLPLLTLLEELDVEACGSIQVLFDIEFKSVCGTGEYNTSKLRRIRVDNLGKLKELWRIEGVNKLCDIHIKCFKGVESIEIINCPVFKNIFTPTTTNFDLGALTKYNTQYSGEKINASFKGEMTEMNERIPDVTYPSYLLHTCHHVRDLELEYDERVEEVVFEMDGHQPLLLPYLEVLNLEGLKETSHVWKCNWNQFLIPQHKPLQFPFQNLTIIYLSYCPNIKYLFSPIMAKYLLNLKSVSIGWCDGIEEVTSSRDDTNVEITTFASSNKNSTFFPYLDSLHLNCMSCLKNIDDQSQSGRVTDASWSLCQYPTKIHVYDCRALSSLIPWYALGQMTRLQLLLIHYCETMMEIFESEMRTNNVDEGSPHGGAATTLTTPTIKSILTLVAPQLSNLTQVSISWCPLLSHVFTFSTLESLKQLKLLSVTRCKAMQVIVKEENEMSSKEVVFPRLKMLELEDLPNLKGYFLGMNEFRWPVLNDVRINDCPQLIMFTPGESKAPKLKYIKTGLGKYSLECGLNFHGKIREYQTTFPTSSSDPTTLEWMPWSFCNLIEINIRLRDGETTIFPSTVLLQLKKLEKIHLCSCRRVEEVFEVVALEGNESHYVVKIPIPNLTQVDLDHVYDLKYIWKTNQRMVLEFPSLTNLSIYVCNSLEHVLTCSMIGSLVQLQNLTIGYCDNIEKIVKEEEEEDRDAKVNGIMQFPRLKSLKLECLRSLKGFCLGKEAFSLPALDTLQIIRCPGIMVFTKGHLSTRELKVMNTSFGKYYVKPDLNSFIKTKQEEGYEF